VHTPSRVDFHVDFDPLQVDFGQILATPMQGQRALNRERFVSDFGAA
jgi:hypothetical protein